MTGEISMDTAAVLQVGKLSTDVATAIQPAAGTVAGGWTPRSDPEFKATLLDCRRRWVDAFHDLRSTSEASGTKLHTSASAVAGGDTASADQF